MFRLIIACLLAAFFVPSAQGAGSDLVVSSDTTLKADLDINGNLIVRDGATLQIVGATVRVGGHVLVEDGARLELGPAANNPAVLAPLDADLGFHILIDGHLQTAGEPRSIIRGLNGDGLSSVLLEPGGVKIAGSAHLSDVSILDGQAGLIVEEGATLDLVDADLRDLYLMGVAVMGTAILERVTITENIIGVSGKGHACSVTARDVDIASWAAAFQMNRCDLHVEGSQLRDGSETIVLHGDAENVVEDTVIHGYMLGGLRADGARMTLSNVSFSGGREAIRGLEVRESNITLDDVTIERNSQYGLNGRSSDVVIHGGAVRSNGEYGIQLVGGSLTGDLHSVDFGQGETANGILPVAHHAIVYVHAEDNGAVSPGLNVTVYRDGEEAFAGGPTDLAPLTVPVQLFGQRDGLPYRAHNFTYVAEHPGLATPLTQAFDPTLGALVVDVSGSASVQSAPGPFVVLGLLAALAIARWRS